MKKYPPIEELLLNNEIPIYRFTVNRKSIFYNKDQIIRWYLPNWNKIINDGHLFNVLVDRKIIQPERRDFQNTLIQIYLLLTFLPKPSSRRENLTGRRSRTFNLNTLLFDPSYNESIFQFDENERRKVKSFVRTLSPKEKEKSLEKIIQTKVFPWLDTKIPIKNLINKAFYEKELVLPLSTLGDEYFSDKVVNNAINILNDKFIGRDLIANPLSIKDIEYIRENILPDPIIEEIRDERLNDILGKLDKPYCNIKKIIEVQRQNKDSKVVIDIATYKNIYLEITEELIIRLRLKQKQKIDKTKISEINELITFITLMRNLPDEDKWKGLLIVRDRFYKQTNSLIFFVNKLENIVRMHLKNFSLLIQKDLVDQEKLSREELRLFIISNIGLRSYDYVVPLFEKSLIQFLNFNKYTLPLFIEVVLNRIRQFEKINLKEILDYQFRIFLRFYPFWHDEIKSSEKERKQESRKREITVRVSDKKHRNKEVLNPKDLIDLIDYDVELKKICTSREIKIYMEKVLHNKTLKSIAKEQKVSPQMIGKIFNRTKRKIQKHYSE